MMKFAEKPEQFQCKTNWASLLVAVRVRLGLITGGCGLLRQAPRQFSASTSTMGRSFF